VFPQLGHSYPVSSVAFSPDGKQIISGSFDSIKLWDTATGREIRTISTFSLNSIALSPDGRQIVSGSGSYMAGGENTLKLWDAVTGREIRSINQQVSSVAFSPDGKNIISGSSDKTVRLWDTATGREIGTYSGQSTDVGELIFTPDGKQIISSFGKKIILWDIVTGREIKSFFLNLNDMSSLAFSSDGRQVVSGEKWLKIIKLWDIETGQEIRTFSGHSGLVNYVTFSPDKRQILSGGDYEDKTIKLWDTTTGREIRTFSGHSSHILSLAFSPDGRYILSGSWDETIKLWDTTTGKEVKTFLGYSSPVEYVTFSSDGRNIAGAGVVNNFENENSFKIWDTATGREFRKFSGHSKGVYSVIFGPDGKSILSSSGDTTIKLWDIATGREIRTFTGHLSGVKSIVFSPNGKQILSGSKDGTVRLWDVSTGKEIAQFISFTDGEWIVITPEGYYNASPNGDKYLNVRVGNNVYGIDQYRATFYKPQIVEARLQGRPDPVRITTTIDDVVRFQPPQITIRSPNQAAQLTTPQVQLSVLVEDQSQPIKEIKILVNGRLVGNDELSKATGTRGIAVRTEKIEAPANQRRLEINVPVTLEPGNNRIQIIATNSYNSEAAATVEVAYQTSRAWDLPNLWILAVGVNKYDSPDVSDLRYAVNDAREMVNAFKAQEGKRFGKVNSLLITDDSPVKPTAANIVDGFDFLSRASQHDIILLFMAGHGITNTSNEFYFISSDSTFNNGQIQRSRAVSQAEIMRVRDLPGKKLIFIDACHAGDAGGNTRGVSVVDNNRLIREIMDQSTVVFMSSKGRQQSLEFDRDRHGVFTYAILQGLKGAAYPDAHGNITMKALDMYVSRTVPEMTDGQQHPESTVKDGNYEDFVIAVK
jgi:WD40 repeat protein/uncharacterized caspase-like protein